jgi:hypothetical protein
MALESISRCDWPCLRIGCAGGPAQCISPTARRNDRIGILIPPSPGKRRLRVLTHRALVVFPFPTVTLRPQECETNVRMNPCRKLPAFPVPMRLQNWMLILRGAGPLGCRYRSCGKVYQSTVSYLELQPLALADRKQTSLEGEDASYLKR